MTDFMSYKQQAVMHCLTTTCSLQVRHSGQGDASSSGVGTVLDNLAAACSKHHDPSEVYLEVGSCVTPPPPLRNHDSLG